MRKPRSARAESDYNLCRSILLTAIKSPEMGWVYPASDALDCLSLFRDPMNAPDRTLAKLKVFVSYSRTDIEFADQLVPALRAFGIEPFIDREGVHGAEQWQQRLGQLILEADTVVFILTPASATSDICEWEVDEALKLNKRIVPVVWRPLGEAKPHDHLRGLNYIFFYDDPKVPGAGFGTGLARLIEALTTDVTWIREHTRLGEQAARWQRDGRPADALPRGMELARLRDWRHQRSASAPELTTLQREFFLASEDAESERNNAERRQLEKTGEAVRRNLWLVGVAALLALALFASALWQSRETERREALVMTSAAQRAIEEQHYERAIRIAVQGLPKPGAAPIVSFGWKAPEMQALEAKLAGAAQAISIRRITSHPGMRKAAFSLDGTRAVIIYDEHEPSVWDTGSGEQLRRLGRSFAGVINAAFSSDGARIVTASVRNAYGRAVATDEKARIWDAGTGNALLNLEGHSGAVTSAVFSPDGERVVTASDDKTARIWYARTGALLLTLQGHTDAVTSAAFSPDGARIVTASEDKTARIWDAGTGETLFTLQGHGDKVVSAVFSRNARRILTASWDRTARIWDTASGAALRTLQGHKSLVMDAAFSPDATRIVTASADSAARIWDADSGVLLALLQGHRTAVVSAAFSSNGDSILTASLDGTMRAWDLRSIGARLVLRGHENQVAAAAFSVDGTRIVTASWDGTARTWDAITGATLLSLKGHKSAVTSAAFEASGKRIVTASADQTARVWRADTGAALFTLQGHDGILTTAVFNADGSRILTASYDNTARVWNTDTGEALLTLRGHDDSVMSASFSSDETRIVTASLDKTARIWDARTGEALGVLHNDRIPVKDAAFSADGERIITASLGSTARVWNARTGTTLLTLRDHGIALSSAEFSADGARIVTASWDNTIRVWDAQSGGALLTLEGHTDGLTRAAFSADGRRIVSASKDGTARVWDADWLVNARGEELVRRACEERLVKGTQTFTLEDASDPILYGLDGTNPCDRCGPLALRYWTALLRSN